MTYHHGDLREAILTAAAETVAAGGPASISLRQLAREVGVTHTAPRHHFGDKRGVLTALATQGYQHLAAELTEARRGSFLDVGVAYVRFALQSPGHFLVMFRPELVAIDDPPLQRALSELGRVLAAGASGFTGDATTYSSAQQRVGGERSSTALAAWGMAHGLATLAVSGALGEATDDVVLATARSALRHLSPEPGID